MAMTEGKTAVTLMRSPRYPIIGLREALDRARHVYEADHRNRIPKELVAKHMGYNSLNGKSLGVISAVSKYGLLEGRADQMWISERAVVIFEHPPGDAERAEALRAAASEPELFNELSSNFPGKASDAALRSFLITKRKFLPEAADRAVRSYRETKELVEAEGGEYNGAADDDLEPPTMPPPIIQSSPVEQTRMHSSHLTYAGPEVYGGHRSEPALEAAIGMRKEIITLDEGDVVISFPEGLSLASVEDLKDHLELFVRKAQRRAAAEQKAEDADS
ncbi:hypothetical protein [Microvirga lenta]|uniref:hypothetical protein n=1 Tax=Microvirga lenta TaxID=2881337 RepID=UPI001CFF8FEB|nr:hypothetical protein [Microvirga lenta]MCB5175529.1 hypothetical protein [Microvirga lenta]